MRFLKKSFAFLLAALLAASLSGCAIPIPGSADYDVSGYIRALLDSSYLGKNESFLSVTGLSEEEAEQNSVSTMENAAVNFCNAYNVYPSDEQLKELEAVMKSAYALAKYTVKEKQESDKGFYVEVEIQPLTIFRTLAPEIEKAREQAEKEASRASSDESSREESSRFEPEYDEYGGYYDEEGHYVDADGGYYDDDGNWVYKEDEPSSREESSEPESSGETAGDESDKFVDAVIELCRNAVQSASASDYDTPIIITLNIVKDEQGNLMLDTNEIEKIDKTVVYFTK